MMIKLIPILKNVLIEGDFNKLPTTVVNLSSKSKSFLESIDFGELETIKLKSSSIKVWEFYNFSENTLRSFLQPMDKGVLNRLSTIITFDKFYFSLLSSRFDNRIVFYASCELNNNRYYIRLNYNPIVLSKNEMSQSIDSFLSKHGTNPQQDVVNYMKNVYHIDTNEFDIFVGKNDKYIKIMISTRNGGAYDLYDEIEGDSNFVKLLKKHEYYYVLLQYIKPEEGDDNDFVLITNKPGERTYVRDGGYESIKLT